MYEHNFALLQIVTHVEVFCKFFFSPPILCQLFLQSNFFETLNNAVQASPCRTVIVLASHAVSLYALKYSTGGVETPPRRAHSQFQLTAQQGGR